MIPSDLGFVIALTLGNAILGSLVGGVEEILLGGFIGGVFGLAYLKIVSTIGREDS